MIVITGVSRGLGAALFDELYQAGHSIVALGRRFTETQLAAAESGRVRLRRTDLADLDSLPDPAELTELVGDAGEVALVHNAGVIEPFAAVGALPQDQLKHAVAVNFTAPMLLTNALLAAVAGDRVVTGPGEPRVRVLYVSSSAAHRVSGGRSVYCATKRGAEMFFEAVAAQYADDPSVSVAIIDPGIIDTDMQVVIRAYARVGAYFPDRQRFLDRYEAGLPSPLGVARQIVAEHFGPSRASVRP
jgi:benzil reductase ((S)-benzoin forming)